LKQQDNMEEKRFEELWERAKAEKYAEDLAAEYPAWRTHRRKTASMVTGVALLLAVSAPIALSSNTSERIYCNNSAFSDNHWTEMADALLMEA